MGYLVQIPWHVPFGEFALKIDALSGLFLAAVFILMVSAAVYAVGYLRSCRHKPVWLHIFFYALLFLALVLIVLADNVVLFLGAWEMMSISSYFLIVFHDEEVSVRRAGFLFLIASHCGTFLLMVMFFLMAHTAGSMSFEAMGRCVFTPGLAATIFLLSVTGFGTKAGFIPWHIWLPHAHPAAPSHVSAVLSGVMIKMGIYGICRVLSILGILPDWCGYLLLAVGISSGLMGVLYALGQHELKKLLAYHSIENIGIIALGLGIGVLGQNHHMPFLAALGFGGAVLHVFNHALFKGLLFLGAGAVIQKTHTGQIDQLGGVAKSMPLVSWLFLTGALAICGLPVFNGFISELMIYMGLFDGLFHLPLHGAFACALSILALALMGALAMSCFAKVYGTVFSGNPRHIQPPEDNKTSLWMLLPMVLLAVLCLWIGVFPQTMVHAALNGAASLERVDPSLMDARLFFGVLSFISGAVFLFMALCLFLVVWRRGLRGGVPAVAETWTCGFSQLSPRAQYTSSSFARPIIDFVKVPVFFKREGPGLTQPFPEKVSMHSSVHDVAEEKVIRPLFDRLADFSRYLDLRRIKYTQIYLVYILLYLIVLLIWKMR